MQIRQLLQRLVFLMFFISLIITGCATKTYDIQLNPDLIQFDDSIKPPLEHPYVVFYRKKQKEVAYIAAYHSFGLHNPTFRTVKKVVEEFSPQIAIIEGIQSSEGISPEAFIYSAIQNCPPSAR